MNLLNDNKINMALLSSGILKPALYEKSTDQFWDDDYISEQLLQIHLDPEVESASKSKETIEAETAFIIKSTDMKKGRTILDMGCGPGLYVKEFAKTGAAVTGIDLSRRSIDYANSSINPEYPNTQFAVMNYLDMDFRNAFDVITLIFYDFCVLSAAEQTKLLAKTHAALKDGGLFLFDIITEHMNLPDATSVSVHEKGLWAPRPYVEILNSFWYENPKTLGQQYLIVDENGATRVIRFYNRLFSLKEITELLNENGFQVKKVYANLKGDAVGRDPKTYGIIAMKA